MLKWHKLEVPPKKYIVRLWCGDEMIHECPLEADIDRLTFEKPFVHPGLFYWCEVAASNDAGLGRFSSQRIYHISKQIKYIARPTRN